MRVIIVQGVIFHYLKHSLEDDFLYTSFYIYIVYDNSKNVHSLFPYSRAHSVSNMSVILKLCSVESTLTRGI